MTRETKDTLKTYIVSAAFYAELIIIIVMIIIIFE